MEERWCGGGTSREELLDEEKSPFGSPMRGLNGGGTCREGLVEEIRDAAMRSKRLFVHRTEIEVPEAKVHRCGRVVGVAVRAVAVVDDELVREVPGPKRRKAIRRLRLVRYQVLGVGRQTALLPLAGEREESAGPARASRGE